MTTVALFELHLRKGSGASCLNYQWPDGGLPMISASI